MNKIMIELENFGRISFLLKEFIDDKQITRNEISEKTGISYNTIDRYYKFEKTQITSIDLINLAKICYVLDCEISDILKYERPSTSNSHIDNSIE